MSTQSRLLVIDDNVVDLKLTSLMLEKNNFKIFTSTTAVNAMEIIANEKINAVLLDVMMPDMDGNEAIKMIRQKYNQIELPIIMITSKSDASDILDSLNIGANDYITKPVHFEIAIKRIETHLTLNAQSTILAKNKELDAIHISIATYNHEINNPLTICLANIASLQKKYVNDTDLENLEASLWRISDILKKTERLLESNTINYENGMGAGSLIDLHKK